MPYRNSSKRDMYAVYSMPFVNYFMAYIIWAPCLEQCSEFEYLLQFYSYPPNERLNPNNLVQ